MFGPRDKAATVEAFILISAPLVRASSNITKVSYYGMPPSRSIVEFDETSYTFQTPISSQYCIPLKRFFLNSLFLLIHGTIVY
jgi:hypothetical protein